MSLLTETPLSDAEAMLDICRSELERCGFHDQAWALRGLEIYDAVGASLAVCTLRSMPPSTEEIDVLKEHIAQGLEPYCRRLAS